MAAPVLQFLGKKPIQDCFNEEQWQALQELLETLKREHPEYQIPLPRWVITPLEFCCERTIR